MAYLAQSCDVGRLWSGNLNILKHRTRPTLYNFCYYCEYQGCFSTTTLSSSSSVLVRKEDLLRREKKGLTTLHTNSCLGRVVKGGWYPSPCCYAHVEGALEASEEEEDEKRGVEEASRLNGLNKDGNLFSYGHLPENPPKLALFAGIARDIQRKLPYYKSDFTDGIHPKAAASVFFLYFACLAPCIAFGGLLQSLTGNGIGIVETLIGTAFSGIFYALFSGQPLTLLGPTGLMCVFTGLLYKATKQMMLPFLPVYGWVGIWTFVFLFILAAVEASDLIRHFTRFTDDIFSALISFGFINEACKGISHLFDKASSVTLDSAFLSLLVSIGTYTTASLLSKIRASPLLLRPMRETLSDFGPPLAILIMSIVPRIFFPYVNLPAMSVPTTITTTSGRPWLVPLFSIPGWGILAAAIPAALLSLLIFLDQNITARLINDPKYHLKKGGGYHLDLIVLGALLCIGSLFGLPWTVASTVPSLTHVRSLATTSQSIHISGDNAESPEESVVGVRENRMTGIIIHVLVGASLLLLPALRLVPIPVTNGLFLYMGFSSLHGNQFVERLKLLLYDPHLYPQHDFIRSVPIHIVHNFTMMQAACLASLWTLKFSSWGIFFPLLILALLPIRNYVAGSLFAPEHMSVLDSH